MINVYWSFDHGRSDAQIEALAAGLKDGDEVTIGNELAVCAIRAYAMRKGLKVTFHWNGHDIEMKPNGQLDWPQGFCEASRRYLAELANHTRRPPECMPIER